MVLTLCLICIPSHPQPNHKLPPCSTDGVSWDKHTRLGYTDLTIKAQKDAHKEAQKEAEKQARCDGTSPATCAPFCRV